MTFRHWTLEDNSRGHLVIEEKVCEGPSGPVRQLPRPIGLVYSKSNARLVQRTVRMESLLRALTKAVANDGTVKDRAALSDIVDTARDMFAYLDAASRLDRETAKTKTP